MIYIASSWKNLYIDSLTECLGSLAIDYYDFRSDDGFHWSQVVPDYKEMDLTAIDYCAMLEHEAAKAGFKRDFDNMKRCSACILLLPSGRSSHLEAGWFIGQGLPVAVFLKEQPVQPELMYKLAHMITDDIDILMSWAYRVEAYATP